MRAGEFEEGAHVLRAKIDMESPNLNLRDPLMYRIRKVPHHRTGTAWCIHPMYDFAHGLCDWIEGITHSICTLEFEDHRPLYDWFLEALKLENRPQQIEFARLNLTYTVLSKRKLHDLVFDKHVRGWDDPRMPTLAGMRRRGYTPEAIRAFCDRIGVAKRDGIVDVGLLEHALREDLNARCPRVMGVLRPLRVVIENYPEGEVEWFEAMNHPEYPDRGSRKLPFSRVLYVERDDFLENAPKQWFRLSVGREVRLRYACLIRCHEVIKDASGEPVELRCTWDPDSRGGTPKDGRKVRGTLHWVSAAHAVEAQVRLYDRLFAAEDPSEGAEEGIPFTAHLNPSSLEVLTDSKLEPLFAEAKAGERVQLERLGYFCLDPDSRPGAPVLNRTIGLRDTWAKIAAKGGPA
jgi:glutaminyl-tRNA synthetase